MPSICVIFILPHLDFKRELKSILRLYYGKLCTCFRYQGLGVVSGLLSTDGLLFFSAISPAMGNLNI